MSDDICIEDERLIIGISQAVADAGGLKHARCCETAGCCWAVHTDSEDGTQAAYDKHLRTDPRHTDREWIDRKGRKRRRLEILPE